MVSIISGNISVTMINLKCVSQKKYENALKQTNIMEGKKDSYPLRDVCQAVRKTRSFD